MPRPQFRYFVQRGQNKVKNFGEQTHLHIYNIHWGEGANTPPKLNLVYVYMHELACCEMICGLCIVVYGSEVGMKFCFY